MLSEQELKRYSSHLVLDEIEEKGQEKLKKSKVLIIGLGGLGSPCALYLGATGVGTLGLVDFDFVEEHNLQRQVIHSMKDIKKSKLDSAKESVDNLNPNVNINLHNIRLNEENVLDVIKEYDLVIDGTDNFNVRYAINDACLKLNKPLVYGSISRFEGQVSVFNFNNGPCYRCLVPYSTKNILNCTESGVLGTLPGVIGTLQATEAIKIILDKGDVLNGRLLLFNALNMKFKEVKLNKNENCRCGGKN
jgi:adenylyltransferase/sulfurtransferase|tara:strand:- start:38239 stop:38982 length:744 start_codon:yes stop_codon:yes gene_type:complete